MNEIQKQIEEACIAFLSDSKKNSRAAHKRMRKNTLVIAKLGKEFRRLSLEEDKKA